MSRETKIDSQPSFEEIVTKIRKIQWEIQNINKEARMLSDFAEEAFTFGGAGGGPNALPAGWPLPEGGADSGVEKWKDGKSSVFLGRVKRLTPSDGLFLRATKYMDLIFVPLVQRNPHILFVHIANRRGVTRGYPWKDFSVLPSDFTAVNHSFFYVADPRHDPERKEKWTEPYLCPLSQTWMVTCSCPIYRNDEFVGVAGIDIDLGKIIEPLSIVLDTTSGGYGLLISARGNLIVSSKGGMNSLRDDHVLLVDGWDEIRDKDSLWVDKIKVGEVTLTSGKARVLHTRFSCNEWSIICILPRASGQHQEEAGVSLTVDENLFPQRSSQTDRVHQPFMSFISSFNESLKQIEKLIEGTEIIGRGVLDHRISIDRKDEIGLLALSINKMAAELKKRRDELHFAYEKISQMDRLSAMGRLTAGIAHEINNPLGIISNYIQILARNPRIHRDVQQDILVIEEEIQRASEIIRRLLNFSGGNEIEKSAVCVNNILQKTLGLLRFQLKSQNIDLIEQYEEHLAFIVGNPTYLQQAFLNILLNAAEAMPEGGTLKLSTGRRVRKTTGSRISPADGRLRPGMRRRAGRASTRITRLVEVSISDTGHGIETKSLDKIFDPFFTLKGHGKGTGLGLSISYGIIKEHDGTIEVKSAPGKGTTVTITLPAFEE